MSLIREAPEQIAVPSHTAAHCLLLLNHMQLTPGCHNQYRMHQLE